jgi:predicted AAA+ superfamily ATPase
MKKERLEEVVLDQYENLRNKNIGFERNVDSGKMINTTLITVISGVRRCGKTTLFLQLMQHFDNFYFLNFDDDRLVGFEITDFQELMILFKKQYKSKTVFFDEIQNIEGWEHFIRRLYDEGYKIFITGSNAKLLSSELATHLTGRYLQVELFPFSFQEILNAKKVQYSKLTTDNKATILKEFDHYLLTGGFPEWILLQDNEYLKRIYNDILYKDLIVRFGIKNVKAFKQLSQFLMTNFCSELSYNSLKTILNFKSTNSVKDYISYLEESYLFFEIYKYDFSLKKQFISNKKIYSIDNGLRNQIAFRFSEDTGKLLENAVFLELKRRGFELYYYKTRNSKEIDFMFYQDGCFQLYQVSSSINDMKTRQREINAIIETNGELPKCRNYIITNTEEDTIREKNIKIDIFPFWKWALGINS